MKILFYGYQGQASAWLDALSARLPGARVREWQAGDHGPADYAIVRNPPADLLGPRDGLKAVFNLGAGVERLLAVSADLPPDVLMVRLDDAGMAAQMIEYVGHAVLHYFRDFDAYERMQVQAAWAPLTPRQRKDFRVGIMGLGALGAQVGKALAEAGFPVSGWSRTPRQIEGIAAHAGAAGLADFLSGLAVLVNMLPLTPDTESILNRELFAQLPRGAYLVNVARGAHLVEDDLLEAIRSGQLAGARLDVCRVEPLPADHALWREPRISITPHISASVMLAESVAQIAEKILALEAGRAVTGVVDRGLGY